MLLLENIHDVARDALTSAGFEVETRSGALDETELISALEGVDLLGIRSKTKVTQAVIQARPELKAIGAALDRLEPAAQQPTQARLAEALYIWPLSAALLISLLMVAASLWSAQLQRLAWRREQRR